MATMYSLFLGVLFAALCRGNGDGSSVVDASLPAQGIFFLLDQKEIKNQGLAAPPKFKSWTLKIKTGTKWSSAKLNSPDVSGSNSLIFLTDPLFKFLTASQPRPFFKASAISTSLQLLNLSPTKILTIEVGCRAFVSKVLSDDFLLPFLRKKRKSPATA